MSLLDIDAWHEDNRPRIVQIMPLEPPIGYLKVILEDGTVQRRPVHTKARIMYIEFESIYHSAPWDYDDPDGDGVFK